MLALVSYAKIREEIKFMYVCIKAAALFQAMKDVKFALLHGIKNSFVVGITEAKFSLHYKV